jgi:hypothetical protein
MRFEPIEQLELFERNGNAAGSSGSNGSKRSSRFRSLSKMPLFDERQRNAAGAQQFVVEFTQNKFGSEALSLSRPQTIDD